MSERFFWYDGDTTYTGAGEGTRLAGANAPEAKDVGGSSTRALSTHATTVGGFERQGTVTQGVYGRDVAQFTDPNGNTLSQTLVDAGMASPMYGEMASGTNAIQGAVRRTLGTAPTGIEADPAFQQLAEYARAQRLEAINAKMAAGGFRMGMPYVADPKEQRGVIDRAWDRGVDNTQATFYGFANALGSVTGINALEKFGEEGMARNIWEAMASPATVSTYEDIDSLADAGIYALEALVEYSPQLAMDAATYAASGALASTGVGAPAAAGLVLSRAALAGIGKSALRRFGGSQAVARSSRLAGEGLSAFDRFHAGGKFGVLTSMYMQNSGESQMQFATEGIDNPELALTLGVGKAALDYYGFKEVLGQAFRGIGRDGVTPDGVADLLKRTAASVGIAGSAESVTEATQTLMDEMAISAQKPGYEIEWANVIDAMLKGGIAGGGVAGAGNLAVGGLQLANKGYDDMLPGASDPVQDTAPEPERDIRAQISSTPTGEANWFTAENAEQAKAIAAEAGKPGKELSDGSVLVAEQQVLDSIPDQPTQDDLRRANGYAQTKDEAAADPEGVVVVETRDTDGAVLRNQLVGKSIVDQVILDQQAKFPGATVETKAPEVVIAERKQAVEVEQAEKAELLSREVKPHEWRGNQKLAERDRQALTEQAKKVGIDPERFKKTGFGEALLARLTGGLATPVTNNKMRRLDDVQAVADLLGLSEAEATARYYDSRNLLKGRNELHSVIQAKIKERFGSPSAFAKALDDLPSTEVTKIAEALGMPQRGGFNVGALVAEIAQRQPKGVESESFSAAFDEPGQQGEAPQKPTPPSERPDNLLGALMEGKLFKKALFGKRGEVLTGQALEDNLSRLEPKEMLLLFKELESWGVDLNGERRAEFLDMLGSVVGEQATYGIGKSRFDDTNVESDEDVVATVEYEPSAMDSPLTRLYKLIEQTPLTDQAADGWPAGTALYLEGIAQVLKAEGRPTALSESEAVALHYARAMASVAVGVMKVLPGYNAQALMPAIVTEFGITDEMMSRAAGREVKAEDALLAMAMREDPRVSRMLALQVANRYGLEDDGTVLTEDELLEVLAEALADDPAQALSEMTRELYSLYGPEGVNRMTLIGAYERSRGDRPLTATDKGHDSGRGEDGVSIDPNSPFGEQSMSDASFFGALRSMSLKHWNFAILPSAEQLKQASFPQRGGVSQEITRRFDGRNLLAVPRVPGSIYGSVVDAVSLALYAQGGERVPATAVEAAGNLMENLSRIMAGAQSSEIPNAFGVARGFIRTIPDDLIIYVRRENGEPVTFGEAMAAMREQQDAGHLDHVLTRQLDDVIDQANLLADELIDALEPGSVVEQAVAKYIKRVPNIREAIARWIDMVNGEKVTVAGQSSYVRKPSPKSDKFLRDAVDVVGRVTIPSLGVTLDEAFSRYLGLRGETKQLARRRREALNSRARMASNRDDTDAIVEQLENADLMNDDEATARRIDEAERSGIGTHFMAEDIDNIDHVAERANALDEIEPAYDPHAFDPLAGLSVEDLMDGEDAAQDAAIRAWYEANKEVQSRLNEAKELAAARNDAATQREARLAEIDDSIAAHMAKVNQWLQARIGRTEGLDRDQLQALRLEKIEQLRASNNKADKKAKAHLAEVDNLRDERREVAGSNDIAPTLKTPAAPPREDAAADGAPLTDQRNEATTRTLSWRRTELPPAKPPKSHPLFRLESTVFGEKPETSLSVEEVEAIAEEFVAAYNGNIELVFTVKQTQEEVYGPESLTDENGRPRIIKGAYHAAGGRFNARLDNGRTLSRNPNSVPGRMVLIAENASSREDVLETLRHEVLGHFGLNTFPAQVKRLILDAILASKKTLGMRSLWRDIETRYADKTADEQAEEVFALVTEREPAAARSLWDRLLALLDVALRKVGLRHGKVGRTELEALARQISGGIRSGQARQRNFPQTDGASFRRAVPDAGMLVARGQRYWKQGVGAVAPVVSMVYSRIARYSPELSRMLFQPTNSEASVHGRSWQQQSRALQDRMMAHVDKLMIELRKQTTGKKAQRRAQLQAMFEDGYSDSPKTEQGKRIRALLNALSAEAKRAGLQSVELDEKFAPLVFDRLAVGARQAELEKLIAQKVTNPDGTPIEPAQVKEIMRGILDGPGFMEGVIAPGMPVGMHANTSRIVDAIGKEQLLKDGWLLRRHEAALFHWVSGISKRAAWEGLFGGEDLTRYAFRNGRKVAGFSPNAKFHELLDGVREQHGEQAAQEILVLVNGALGRHPQGYSMPGWLRTTQEFVTGWVGMTVLAFSGIASIPELALPFVRAGGRVGIGELFTDMQQAKRFARDMGIVLSDASEQVIWQMTGEQYRSPLIQKAQSIFFKLNLNDAIVRTSRTLATAIGIRYLLNAAATGDVQALARLNIDAGTIHAWEQAGRPTWSPDLDAVTADIASKVSDAVSQFVNEATLNPSKFQATGWGNNPWFKMIWHLKHFLYTYADNVLLGIYRDMRRRFKHMDQMTFAQFMAVSMPLIVFGIAVLPLAAASLEARDWVRRLNGKRGQEYEDALEYFSAVFTRAGGFGPLDALINMRQQQEYGVSVFGALGPVPGKIDMLFGGGEWTSKARQLIPVVSQNPGLARVLE